MLLNISEDHLNHALLGHVNYLSSVAICIAARLDIAGYFTTVLYLPYIYGKGRGGKFLLSAMGTLNLLESIPYFRLCTYVRASLRFDLVRTLRLKRKCSEVATSSQSCMIVFILQRVACTRIMMSSRRKRCSDPILLLRKEI